MIPIMTSFIRSDDMTKPKTNGDIISQIPARILSQLAHTVCFGQIARMSAKIPTINPSHTLFVCVAEFTKPNAEGEIISQMPAIKLMILAVRA